MLLDSRVDFCRMTVSRQGAQRAPHIINYIRQAIMTTIKTKYGYSVDCYGDCNEYATISMCFDDEMFDGYTDSTFNNWRSAVKELAEYAHRNGTELVQLESDE